MLYLYFNLSERDRYGPDYATLSHYYRTMDEAQSAQSNPTNDSLDVLSGIETALEKTTRRQSQRAARLFVLASKQMALGLAAVLSRWWHRSDPVQAVFSEHVLTEVELDKQRDIAEILRARLARFPARQRRHYAPEERFEIIRLVHTHGISHTEAGRLFVVDPNTIARWEREVMARPDGKTVGTLVRASPPLRGYDDVIVRLVQYLDRFGIGGSTTIAQMLARAGIRISRETVRRYRKRRRSAPRL
jgi:transposase-like protein